MIYRDGVSEGEYWQVHEQEISRIDSASDFFFSSIDEVQIELSHYLGRGAGNNPGNVADTPRKDTEAETCLHRCWQEVITSIAHIGRR